MKVTFISNKNNSSNSFKKDISFEAGLTSEMLREIQKADVVEISRKFAKQGIPTDFQGNKAIAWYNEKSIKILKQLNKKYKLRWPLPEGIFMVDFANLNGVNPDMYGFCNMVPYKLIKNSDKIIQPGTVFFNNFETFKKQVPQKYQWLFDWNYINEIADYRYENKDSATACFLDIVLHEAIHAAWIKRLLYKFKGDVLAKKIELANEPKQIAEYQRKYGPKVSQICDYTLTSPFDSVACDMSRTIINSLDKETLLPIKNPFIDTPYENLSISQRVDLPVYSDQDRPLKEILRYIWNGKLE